MTRFLAVDPGTRSLGFAEFDDARLVCAGALRAKNLEGMVNAVRDLFQRDTAERLIIERPRYRKTGRSNPNDLMALSIVVGVVAGSVGGGAYFVFPEEWKKSVPKAIVHARLWLDDLSRATLDGSLKETPKTSHPDVLDAVSLGVWWWNERAPR